MKSLSQRQLCEHFSWDYRTIAQEAKAKGLSTHAYVQQKTGWILRQERYYPPDVETYLGERSLAPDGDAGSHRFHETSPQQTENNN